MDVFLVPVGSERHELYCEVPDDPQPSEAAPARGFLTRLVHRFREMLAEAERQRRGRSEAPAPEGWLGRVKARTMRWVAESIAEQRLLWHLRRQTEARLFYPDDLSEEDARLEVRRQLQRDFDKHRFWLAIDSLLFAASGLLVLIPGPNVVAYYFAFRIVGHYLSLRGARQGLSGVAWCAEPSAPLRELRGALDLDPATRDQQVVDIALRLQLEHLASFFRRSATA